MIINLAEYKRLRSREEAANYLTFAASTTKVRKDLSDYDKKLICLWNMLGHTVAENLESAK